jgi:hypothetical protein
MGALSRTRMGNVEVGLRYGQENRRGCLIGAIRFLLWAAAVLRLRKSLSFNPASRKSTASIDHLFSAVQASFSLMPAGR